MKEKILNNLRDFVDSELIIGDPIEISEITLIPILNIMIGAGIKDKSAGGGGISIQPTAVIMIDKGEVSYFSIDDNASKKEIKQRLSEIINKIESLD